MSPNYEARKSIVRVEPAPTRRGWHIASIDAATGTADNIAFTQGLDQLFGEPELVIRGLPFYQARSLLTRVAQRFTAGPGGAVGTRPTRLSAGHYSIELVDTEPPESVERACAFLEVVWSSPLVEVARPASGAA